MYVKNTISYTDTRNRSSGTAEIVKSVALNKGFFEGESYNVTKVIDFSADALGDDLYSHSNLKTTSLEFFLDESCTTKGVTFGEVVVNVD